jgi:hypothetical protein
MARITIAEDGTRGAFVIIVPYVESLNFFLKDDIEADETNVGRTRKTKTMKETTVRRGPSDLEPFRREESTADYMYDPTLRSGNALPGREIVIWTDPKKEIVREKRQMTLVGRAIDFQEYFQGKFQYNCWVNFAEGGSHYFLDAEKYAELNPPEG